MVNLLKELTIRKYYILKLINEENKSYLKKSGWINSFKSRVPIDKFGNPIPWLSLPSVYFLRTKLTDLGKDFCVFEYGAGNSTVFFRKLCKEVMSVEYDKSWVQKLDRLLDKSGRSRLIFIPLDQGKDYENAIKNEDGLFQIILIDGRRRVDTIKNSIEKLAHNGVLILDDSHRTKYYDGIVFLRQNGFRELPFWGMGPGSIYEKCTTIFYKEENCLGI